MQARTKMPVCGNLVKAYKTSAMDFRKYCHRYGVIVYDRSWENEAGAYRDTWYHIDGVKAKVRMHNSEVIRYGYGLIE